MLAFSWPKQMASTVISLSGEDICKLESLGGDDTVSTVKSKIASLTGWPAHSLKLGINMTRDHEPISTYGWQSGIPITAVRSAAGTTAPPKPSPAPETAGSSGSGAERGVLLQPVAPEPEPTAEYGYLQIDKFGKKQPGPKYWVPLPRDIRVERYLRPWIPGEKTVQPLRSCLRQRQHSCKAEAEVCCSPRSTLSESSDSTDSTRATAGANRVHFCDGTVPGAEPLLPPAKSLHSYAEWVYVDRDACGFSLYQYAPEVPSYKDFASSQFACEFLQELKKLEECNHGEQLKRLKASVNTGKLNLSFTPSGKLNSVYNAPDFAAGSYEIVHPAGVSEVHTLSEQFQQMETAHASVLQQLEAKGSMVKVTDRGRFFARNDRLAKALGVWGKGKDGYIKGFDDVVNGDEGEVISKGPIPGCVSTDEEAYAIRLERNGRVVCIGEKGVSKVEPAKAEPVKTTPTMQAASVKVVNKIAELEKGTIVHVLEVINVSEEKLVRARISNPAGWITLSNTRNGFQWAIKDDDQFAKYRQEEKELDQSLRLAGVKECALRDAA